MTNKDRQKQRYLHRKEKRNLKKQNFLNSMPTYEEVFTFENLWHAFWLSRKEVSWKPSIQIFQQNLSTELVKLLNELHSEEGFKSRGFIEFNLCERGKMRHIKSIDIKERVVQRCFCDNYLVPLLSHNLIYDNGASLKGKGIDFTLNRLEYHLKKYYKKYNTNKGYILLYDFSNYFGNIDHKILYEKIDPLIQDNKCKKLCHYLIDVFGNKGLGLGSQVSQILAIYYPTNLDYKISSDTTVESYARYMDDGYAIFCDKAAAAKCVTKLQKEVKDLNIILNPKKIRICKLGQSFIFLKKRFYLTDEGEIIIKLNKNNIFKHRRKINKILGLVNKEKLDIDFVKLSHKSWKGQLKRYKNKKAIFNIDKQIKQTINNYS